MKTNICHFVDAIEAVLELLSTTVQTGYENHYEVVDTRAALTHA